MVNILGDSALSFGGAVAGSLQHQNGWTQVAKVAFASAQAGWAHLLRDVGFRSWLNGNQPKVKADPGSAVRLSSWQQRFRKVFTFGLWLDPRNTDALFSVMGGATVNVLSVVVGSLRNQTALTRASQVAFACAAAGLRQFNRDARVRAWMNGNELETEAIPRPPPRTDVTQSHRL